MQENITIGQWRANYSAKMNKASSIDSNYAGYAYDAMWVYAYALDKLLKKNHSYLANFHEDNATKLVVYICILSCLEKIVFSG